MPEQQKAKYFLNLDSLRSIACLIVLFAHTFELSNFSMLVGEVRAGNPALFFLNGGNGVQIFFTLSGFLITYLLLHEEETKFKVNILHFYIRRILRIWPMYFFTVFVGLLFYPLLKAILNQDLNWAYTKIYHFFFLSNVDIYYVEKYFPGRDAAIVDITWSVSIEEQFYLVWPLLLLIPLSKIQRIILLSLLGTAAVVFQLYNHSNPELNYYSTWSCALNLIGGGLLAFALYDYIQEKTVLIIPKWFNLLCYVIIFIAVIFKPFSIDYLVSRWLLILSVLYIIMDQTANTNRLFALSNIPLLQSFSKLTYSVYLVHPMVQLAILQITKLLNLSSTQSLEFIKFFLTIIITIGFSLVTYTFIEKKFLGLKNKFLD